MTNQLGLWLHRHWTGKHSVASSVLLAGAVQVAWRYAASTFLSAALQIQIADDFDPLSSIASGILYYLLILPVFAWWLVGAFRSGLRVTRERHQTPWVVVAGSLVSVMLGFQGYLLVLDSIDPINAAFGDPQWGPHRVEVTNNGRELKISGYLTFPVVTEAKHALVAESRIKTVALSSSGGRLGAAKQLGRLISQHTLDTVVYDRCDSACIVVFLAGKKRFAFSESKLGFHSAYLVRDDDGAASAAMNEQVIEEQAAAGINAEFLKKAYRGRDNIWYPTMGELKAARVVTEVIDQE